MKTFAQFAVIIKTKMNMYLKKINLKMRPSLSVTDINSDKSALRMRLSLSVIRAHELLPFSTDIFGHKHFNNETLPFSHRYIRTQSAVHFI